MEETLGERNRLAARLDEVEAAQQGLQVGGMAGHLSDACVARADAKEPLSGCCGAIGDEPGPMYANSALCYCRSDRLC